MGRRLLPGLYLSLAALSRLLRVVLWAFPGRLGCHSEIAPGRKTDPGPYFSRAVLAEAEASL